MKPRRPRTSIRIGLVCSQRSAKKPMAPPKKVVPARMKGSSTAIAYCCEKLFTCFWAGVRAGSRDGLLSGGMGHAKSVAHQVCEWLRIQPAARVTNAVRMSAKSCVVEMTGAADSAPGFFIPSVMDQAKIIVEGRKHEERGNDRKNWMMRLQERLKNKIFAEEARRRRNACE